MADRPETGSEWGGGGRTVRVLPPEEDAPSMPGMVAVVSLNRARRAKRSSKSYVHVRDFSNGRLRAALAPETQDRERGLRAALVELLEAVDEAYGDGEEIGSRVTRAIAAATAALAPETRDEGKPHLCTICGHSHGPRPYGSGVNHGCDHVCAECRALAAGHSDDEGRGT